MGRQAYIYAAVALGVTILSGRIAATAQKDAAPPAAWTYDGSTGPGQWAHLSPAYAACGRQEQSPINLSGAISARLGALTIDWRPVPIHVVRNGHAVEAEASEPGSKNRIVLADNEYRMVQFHLHHPAEHRINGRSYPLEVHFVNRSSSGELTVLGVLFKEGRANPALQQMIDHAPIEVEDDKVLIDPRKLLPAQRSYFRYEGSLTTPPCSETVNWVVMATPITASAEQIAAVTAFYGNNARPLQPLNRRFLLVSQ